LRDWEPPTQCALNQLIRIFGDFDLAIGSGETGALRTDVQSGQYLAQRPEQIKPASRGKALKGKTTTRRGQLG
jgi:hypothetical protein